MTLNPTTPILPTIFGALLAISSVNCCKEKEKPDETSAAAVPACPTRFADLSETQKGGETTCSCLAVPGGPVWGAKTYTTDSILCRAAVHAGAIPATGGTLKVKATQGCSFYEGSQANGVESRRWDKFPTSFFFPGFGDGACPAPRPIGPKDPCPARFRDLPDVSATTSVTCTCEPNAPVGSVWGDGVYTQDSSICQAAKHVGAIDKAGGQITAKATKGCSSYTGSQKNGVTTQKWGPFEDSFYFPSKTPTPTCP